MGDPNYASPAQPILSEASQTTVTADLDCIKKVKGSGTLLLII